MHLMRHSTWRIYPWFFFCRRSWPSGERDLAVGDRSLQPSDFRRRYIGDELVAKGQEEELLRGKGDCLAAGRICSLRAHRWARNKHTRHSYLDSRGPRHLFNSGWLCQVEDHAAGDSGKCNNPQNPLALSIDKIMSLKLQETWKTSTGTDWWNTISNAIDFVEKNMKPFHVRLLKVKQNHLQVNTWLITIDSITIIILSILITIVQAKVERHKQNQASKRPARTTPRVNGG